MASLLDTDFSYHGISYDERMAIFHLFRDDEELKNEAVEVAAGIITEGKRQ